MLKAIERGNNSVMDERYLHVRQVEPQKKVRDQLGVDRNHKTLGYHSRTDGRTFKEVGGRENFPLLCITNFTIPKKNEPVK